MRYFKYSFELLCKKSEESANYESTFKDRVVGATEFHEGTADELSGVKVIDDHTLEIRIIQPSASFVYALAHTSASVIAKEAFASYGDEMHVGVGAFIFSTGGDMSKELYLVHNPKYYKHDTELNRIPYLDSIHFSFYGDKLKELDVFNSGGLDIIDGLPSTKVTDVVMENISNFDQKPPVNILVIEPEMVTQFYEFNTKKPPFDDVRVRQAINYAVDRQKVLTNVLNGQGKAGQYGLTPDIRTFSNYPKELIQGYAVDVERAQALLKDAGYPNGDGFPAVTLEINSGGNINPRVATEIRRQLMNNLGISVEISQVSFFEKIENSKYGKSNMYRSAWVADFPSPESFLSICYGGNVPEDINAPSYPNTMRWTNAEFDSLFLAGMGTIDETERLRIFAEAENVMIQDAPLMVLWYGEDYKMIHSKVRGYYHNPMNFMDYSEIYFKEMTREEVEAMEKAIRDQSANGQ